MKSSFLVYLRVGTVFQTAAYFMFVIPRLRPGLLSLRSVLASSQVSTPCSLMRTLNCDSAGARTQYPLRFGRGTYIYNKKHPQTKRMLLIIQVWFGWGSNPGPIAFWSGHIYKKAFYWLKFYFIRSIRSIRVRSLLSFFSNTDLSDWRGCLVVGRYCLPDSYHYMLYKSRDFVPGYSRFARYWLPARSPLLVPLWERLTVIRLGFEPRTHCVLVGAIIAEVYIQKSILKKRMLLIICWVIRLGFEPRTHSLEGCCSNPTELPNQSH